MGAQLSKNFKNTLKITDRQNSIQTLTMLDTADPLVQAIQHDRGIWTPTPNKKSVMVLPFNSETNHATWKIYNVKLRNDSDSFCYVFGIELDSSNYYLHRVKKKKLLLLKPDNSINPRFEIFSKNDLRVFQDSMTNTGKHCFHPAGDAGEAAGPFIGFNDSKKLVMSQRRVDWDFV